MLRQATLEGLTLVRARTQTGFKGVRPNKGSASKPFQAILTHGGRKQYLGCFATAEEAALAVARFLGPAGAAAPTARKRPAASGAGPSAAPKRGKQPADDDDDAYVAKAEPVSDDDEAPTPPAAPPVLTYCERPAVVLDGRWVCAESGAEGEFSILGRENE